MRRRLALCLTALAIGAWAAAQEVQFPAASGSVKFAVLGDNGNGEAEQYEVGRQMEAARARLPFEFVIMLGDNMYGRQQPEDFVAKFERPYAARDASGRIAAVGTYLESVALAAEREHDFDPVSLGELIVHNYATFPHTSREGVWELGPGSVTRGRMEGEEWALGEASYWQPSEPREWPAAAELRGELIEALSLAGGLVFCVFPYRVAQSTGHLLGPISALLPGILWALERRRFLVAGNRERAPEEQLVRAFVLIGDALGIELPQEEARRPVDRAQEERHDGRLRSRQGEVEAHGHRHVFRSTDAVGVVEGVEQDVVVDVAEDDTGLVDLPALAGARRTAGPARLVEPSVVQRGSLNVIDLVRAEASQGPRHVARRDRLSPDLGQ